MESTDLTSGLVKLFTDFQSAWFLGVTTLCYLCIQILRGKAGFEIPFVTLWLDGKSKESKTYTILLFFSLAGFFSAFANKDVTVGVLVDGLLKGLAIGVGTVGTRSAVKQGIEGAQVYKESKVDSNKNGSAT